MSNNKFSGNFGEGGRIVFKFKKIAKKKGNCFFYFELALSKTKIK